MMPLHTNNRKAATVFYPQVAWNSGDTSWMKV
jgi:hypothetical protein